MHGVVDGEAHRGYRKVFRFSVGMEYRDTKGNTLSSERDGEASKGGSLQKRNPSMRMAT